VQDDHVARDEPASLWRDLLVHAECHPGAEVRGCGVQNGEQCAEEQVVLIGVDHRHDRRPEGQYRVGDAVRVDLVVGAERTVLLGGDAVDEVGCPGGDEDEECEVPVVHDREDDHEDDGSRAKERQCVRQVLQRGFHGTSFPGDCAIYYISISFACQFCFFTQFNSPTYFLCER